MFSEFDSIVSVFVSTLLLLPPLPQQSVLFLFWCFLYGCEWSCSLCLQGRCWASGGLLQPANSSTRGEYSASELEHLALVKIQEHFKAYLVGKRFKVYKLCLHQQIQIRGCGGRSSGWWTTICKSVIARDQSKSWPERNSPPCKAAVNPPILSTSFEDPFSSQQGGSVVEYPAA